jgi:hypothetical protein
MKLSSRDGCLTTTSHTRPQLTAKTLRTLSRRIGSLLSSYLSAKGVEAKETAAANTDGLVAQVKNYWYETEDKAEDAWSSVKDWIFDR